MMLVKIDMLTKIEIGFYLLLHYSKVKYSKPQALKERLGSR